MTDRELQSLRNLGNEREAAADEIVRLRAAVMSTEGEWVGHKTLTELRKDAERYRWLRDKAYTAVAVRMMQNMPGEMDAAIDAAMKEQP
jgi:hypothetical protein